MLFRVLCEGINSVLVKLATSIQDGDFDVEKTREQTVSQSVDIIVCVLQNHDISVLLNLSSIAVMLFVL